MVSLATESVLVKPHCHEYIKKSHMTTVKLRVPRGRIVTHFRQEFQKICKCLPLIGVKKSRFQRVTY